MAAISKFSPSSPVLSPRWASTLPKWANPNARRSRKWPALVVFSFFVWFFCRHAMFLPVPPRYPSSLKECPTRPPQPPIVAPPGASFNWRGIAHRYPVQTFSQLPTGKRKKLAKVQFEFDREEAETRLYGNHLRKRRQAAVKATFARSWKSYKNLAFGKDELQPISGKPTTTFGGWGATLVDSLDTLYIMGLKDEFREAVDAVAEIDFKPKSGELNMFEITIRYLGGLLAAYDLTECKDYRLLEKAIELGDMVYASFDTRNRMPVTRWNAEGATSGVPQEAASQGIIAEMASFSMEFTRLSQLTGDMRYYDAVTRITDILDQQQNFTNLPGLWPVGVDVQTPDLTKDTQFSLGTMADSAYEYLGKTYQLLHGVGAAVQYKMMYEYAMDSAIKYLLYRPMVPDQADILMPGVVRAMGPGFMTLDPQAQHLGCFVGGMLALGGRLVQNETHVEYGRKVTDGCIWTYQHAPHGIMPESSTMIACPSHEPCPYNASIPQQHPGFAHVSDARYMLRPEAIESVFYMYRITGDSSYQDVAWSMFESIDQKSRTEFANAAIQDVMKDDGVKQDKMESFWLAETLKYFYLIFSEPEFMSLDEWVFNTEAHPFRLA